MTASIINPIFDQCCELTTDEFWKDIFKSAARGVFPKKFGYKDGLIVYRKGSKDITSVISSDPRIAIHELRKFFKQNGGLVSDRDIAEDDLQEETETELISGSDKIETFTELSRKTQKRSSLVSYVYKITEQQKLNKSERLRLIQLLNLSLVLDVLDDTNVVVTNGCISDIRGLKVINGADGRHFSLRALEEFDVTEFTSRSTSRSSAKVKQVADVFIKMWEKYINSYMKIQTKSGSSKRDESSDSTEQTLNIESC